MYISIRQRETISDMKHICEKYTECPKARICAYSEPHDYDYHCDKKCEMGYFNEAPICIEHKLDDSAISDSDRAWTKTSLGYIAEIKRLKAILDEKGISYVVERTE